MIPQSYVDRSEAAAAEADDVEETDTDPADRDRSPRTRVQDAAADAGDLEAVRAVDVYTPRQGMTDRWELQVIGPKPTPAAILAIAAEHELANDCTQRVTDGLNLFVATA